jgi:hypothetical protein
VTERSPLPHKEVRRLLADLQSLTDDDSSVVIGGQAIYFWAYYFNRQTLLTELPPGSKDLDIIGTKRTVLLAAKLLHGTPRVSSPGEITPSAGAVRFRDSEGEHRILDVLSAPYGLDPAEIRRTAIRVSFTGESDDEPVPFRVMHPMLCMISRVKNIAGLGRNDEHALNQLRVSIACLREFARAQLDDASHPHEQGVRAVLNINKRIYTFTRDDIHAREVFVQHGIDTFDAVLADEHLPERFHREAYPRWREDLRQRRA